MREAMDYRIRLLVVTYRTAFSASDTLTSIVDYFSSNPGASHNVCLSVWDNSPTERRQELDEFLSGTPIEVAYTSTPQNLPLCEVYNRTVAERADFDFLCIFDQDTQLTSRYFNEVLRLAECGIPLALPQIYSGEFLYSPSYRKFCLGRHFENIAAGPHTSKNMLAINSGMMINAGVFDIISYDERVRFYGTDTWFMVQYEKHYPELYIMESKLCHSLRIRQENSAAWLRNYYKDQIRINKIIFNNGILEQFITWMYCAYLGIFHARR